MKIKSPLDSKSNVTLIKKFSTESLIKRYQDELQIDVKKFFGKSKNIFLYQCEKTGYKFFYPFNLAGDNDFYQNLSQFNWYYMKWKWEHEISKSILKKSDTVLEVGCANGEFLEKIKPLVKKVVGVELNSEAVSKAKDKGLDVKEELIENFCKKNKGKFDIVTSYQVMEHISDVESFIGSSIVCLKPGGKLVISVPNNFSNSPITEDSILNFPPHHMGRWDTNSLIGLNRIFPLKVNSIYYEPLQGYHQGFFEKIALNKIQSDHKTFFSVSNLIIKKFTNYLTNIYRGYLPGHSILIVFTYEK